jgi:diguanylate cyclase (GGDEF)-like protein
MSDMTNEPSDGERRAVDRRSGEDRRRPVVTNSWQGAAWSDQRIQFITRYLFGALTWVYMNLVHTFRTDWMSLTQMNLMIVSYFVWVTAVMLHARRYEYSPFRFRLAMWIDVLYVSILVLNDPYTVPLMSMIYIIIVLGNGMRYGMQSFTESLIACFLGAMITLTLRYAGSLNGMSGGVIFMNVFGGIILIYAYILMYRVDAARREHERNSMTDPLTGLMNRGGFMDAAEQLMDIVREHRHSCTLMFCDMDKFKQINDSAGHAEGDRVLQAVAGIIRKNIRQVDLAGRYGGDEFVVVLDGTGIDDAEHIGLRIQQEVRQWALGNDLDVSLTIGVGEAMKHGESLQDLLDNVDKALYRSKQEHGAGGLCRA